MSRIHRIARLLAIIVPTVPFVIGTDIITMADATGHDDGNSDANRVTGQAVTNLCDPILGSGKTTGVPIVVKDAGGTQLTDLTGLTFELTDGTNVQDVTAQIKTPQQEQLVTGQSLSANGGKLEGGFGSAFRAFGAAKSATGPSLDVSNTGFFFLDCTPVATTWQTTFPAGTVLRAKSGGTVISSGSLAGRGAVRLEEFGTAPTGDPTVEPTMYAITPSGASHTDFAKTYSDYLTLTGVRFRPAFAAMAIMELSNSTSSSGGTTVTCWDDLASKTGSTWTWTTAGQNFIDELTSSNATTWPILQARTKGPAGPTVGGLSPCNLSISSNEDDFFMNFLGAQLLLIDGPRGNVPTSISNTVSALKPAVVLAPVGSPATSTSTSIAPTSTSIAPTSTSSTIDPSSTSSSSSTTTAVSTSSTTSSTSSTPSTTSTSVATPSTSSTIVSSTSSSTSSSTTSSSTVPTGSNTTSSVPRTTVPRTTVPRRPATRPSRPTNTVSNQGGASSATTTTSTSTSSTTSLPAESSTTTTVAPGTVTPVGGIGGDILPPDGLQPVPTTLASLALLSLGSLTAGWSRRRARRA